MKRIAVASVVIISSAAGVAADDGFFRGKTVTIINSTGNGGSYFNLAQSVSRYMPKYLDGNPAMIVKSMPGAGNVLATNFMYNAAPKDGTHIATINNSIPLHQVINGRGVQYDATRFNWLGSTGTYNSVAYVWHTAGIRTVKDLESKEVLLGGTGPGSSIVIYPAVMNKLLGSRFKFILGYKSTHEIDIAMERGEVQARTGSYTGLRADHPDWIAQKKVDIILQIGGKRDPELPNVPLLTELARNEAEREILKLMSSPISLGRPYLAPPGVPVERVETLRKAFMATLRDPGFLDEARKLDHEIDPLSAEEVTKIVAETVNAPKSAIAVAREIMGGVE
ncbi:MAG: Bug family tripartite tricarboxylate transporter substrate binding protein [Beijerinckiaceae bacterium]